MIHFGTLEGGTELTVRHCMRQGKPYKLIDAEEISESRAAELVLEFVETFGIATLNVAGPRQSRDPRAQPYARAVFELVLAGTPRP